MKAIGITCGIGSLLLGARQAGFDIVGNVEWRKYYHAQDFAGRNTFTENFPGAAFHYNLDSMTADEIERFMGADLALGHPECGHFSQLSAMNPDQTTDPADIPLFVDIVAKLRPRFFVMDDLPKSFLAFPMSEYATRLANYDLFPEWISNWGYGNIQKNRKRFFMIGSLREERWAFRPGEVENHQTLREVLDGLGEPRPRSNYPNHDPHVIDEICARAKHLVTLGRDQDATFGQLRDFFLANPPGTTLKYIASTGEIKHKPSHSAGYLGAHSHVLDGASVQVHQERGLPYTIRERARIQGFPDDFVFYGTKLDSEGQWNHEKNNHMVKQTGKAMPIQFARYVSEQVAAAVGGEEFNSSGRRIIPANPYIDQAKSWYCENVGYSDQARACDNCWLYAGCTIRARKYQIGEPKVGQRDLIDPGVVPLPKKKPARLAPPPPRTNRRFVETDDDQEDMEF